MTNTAQGLSEADIALALYNFEPTDGPFDDLPEGQRNAFLELARFLMRETGIDRLSSTAIASPPFTLNPPPAITAPETLPPHRRVLPTRRASETFPIEADGAQYYATAGYYDRSRTKLGEVFLNSRSKLGSAVDIAASEAATVASIAIQYGVPPQVIRDAVKRDADGNPHGPLGAALDVLLRPPTARDK